MSAGHLGIQYLKAFGYKVIGVDLSKALEEAKAQGADHVFSPKTDTDYVEQIRNLTGKGCHAAINFTNSVPAYSAAPSLLRMNGIMVVAGVPQKPLQFQAVDVSTNRFRVRGSSNGITLQLKDCLAFSHKHDIRPHVTQFKLEQFEEMLKLVESSKHRGRLGVVFDWALIGMATAWTAVSTDKPINQRARAFALLELFALYPRQINPAQQTRNRVRYWRSLHRRSRYAEGLFILHDVMETRMETRGKQGFSASASLTRSRHHLLSKNPATPCICPAPIPRQTTSFAEDARETAQM